ncbi:DUF3316 domain-containing protein [Vibrio sp. JC009]|uniref:DUF3316 domain-containing protein n=1 Tax=Vibrio sp. JC009 TaxID=2912314 RepID=UPI0023AE827D|nr:DUF3316 domain-containing protein [Vibrio sp. JC009]WED23855.1 DUF3316 domain-containing protein [Vibrio sp. JC009]
MKKLSVLTAALILSASAMAATETVYNHSVLKTDGFATKQEAYNSGFDVADDLKAMSNHELKKNLSVFETSAKRVTIDDTVVTVEEFAEGRDAIQYRANVDVNYHYTATDHDHS